VSVVTDEAANYAVIDLEVNVEYGVDVYKAARHLQRAVKNAVENMTGLTSRRQCQDQWNRAGRETPADRQRRTAPKLDCNE